MLGVGCKVEQRVGVGGIGGNTDPPNDPNVNYYAPGYEFELSSKVNSANDVENGVNGP